VIAKLLKLQLKMVDV